MRNKNMLFSELRGFVIYDRLVLNKYLEKNELFDTDILSYFTGTNHGDTVIQKGVVVPILNIPPDYYSIKMVNNVPRESILNISNGWSLYSNSGIVTIVGIGYLKDVTTINLDNSLLFNISKGWYKLNIISYYENSVPTLGLRFIKTKRQPPFHGNIDIDFHFE